MINSNLAEKIMGHSTTIQLDNSYFHPSKERTFEEYAKAIPELTIDEAVKLREDNKLKEKRIHELESDKDRRIIELEEKFDNIHELLEKAIS